MVEAAEAAAEAAAAEAAEAAEAEAAAAEAAAEAAEAAEAADAADAAAAGDEAPPPLLPGTDDDEPVPVREPLLWLAISWGNSLEAIKAFERIFKSNSGLFRSLVTKGFKRNRRQ